MENNARQQIKNTHGQSSGDSWARVKNPWKLATHYALEAASMADQLADAVEQTAKAAIREAGELGTAAGGALASLSTEQLGRNLQRHVRRIRRILFSTIVVFCVYVALGALFFWYVEGWTVADSAYFAVVSISTVGYGDMLLRHWYSKLFNAAYILFGCAIVFTRFSEMLSSFQAAAVTRAQFALSKGAEALLPQGAVQLAARHYLKRGLVGVLVLFGAQAALAVPYAYVKMDFPAVAGEGGDVIEAASQRYIHYGHALYFSWITACT